MIQYSTALSELLLATTCFYLTYMSRTFSTSVYFSLFVTGLAAFAGMIRFGLDEPPTLVYRWHRTLTETSFIFTPAVFAANYLNKISYTGYVIFLLAPAILFFTLPKFQPNVKDLLMTGLSVLSIIFILYISYKFTLNGILGCLLLVIGSVFARMEGKLFGFKTVDLFHYVLIPSLFFLTKGVASLMNN